MRLSLPARRKARSVCDHQMRERKQIVPAVPGREFEKRVGPQQQTQRTRRADALPHFVERIKGITRTCAAHLAIVDAQQRVAVRREAHHLKALKLPTFLRDYTSVAATCSQERSSYPQYLLHLAERELIDRERRATERRIREAAFPVLKTIETFDFGAQPSINEPLVRELLRGEYMAKRENVLLVGPSGTGKTHLATALAMAACAQGRRVRFWRVTELITTLREADQERHLLRMRQQLAKLDLLVLDEFGYVPASKAGAELLFDVIGTAYERSSVILTTNLAFENWTEVLGNERLTGAALDRLTHRCHIVELTGESYRLQDAKRRRSSTS